MIVRLARLSEISFAGEAPSESAQMIVRGVVAALPLAGVVDLSAEKTRLQKEIGKEQGEVKKIDAKLNNANFVAKAPEEVVEENRERRGDILSRHRQDAGGAGATWVKQFPCAGGAWRGEGGDVGVRTIQAGGRH